MRHWILAALLWLGLANHADAQDKNVTVYEVRRGEVVSLVANLVNCSEATITVTGSLENMVSSLPLPLTVSVTAPQQVLASFQRSDPRRPWSYQWESYWKYGRRLEGNPGAYSYSLPYRSGPFLVIQGAYSTYSHYTGSQDEEAIDWAMPEGTVIYPARPGTVVGFHSDYSDGGPDKQLVFRCNYLILRHDNGTYAEYLHLRKNGVLVRLGDKVTLNQPIALSGNTGYTNEPHLHFAVFYPQDGHTRITLPLLFKSRSGGTTRMEEGRAY
jgi:murein DD-endopeptidase MepM/ murein hydrolase activator NlpD